MTDRTRYERARELFARCMDAPEADWDALITDFKSLVQNIPQYQCQD